jgi:hypothetical protein
MRSAIFLVNINYSVTAGMVVKNIDTTYATREQFIEYRGHSWTMGGVQLQHTISVMRCY